MISALATALILVAAPTAFANHPVLVEGNCNNDADPAFSPVPAAGTCGDYDGDTRIGNAEDNDGATDRVFGTLNGALGAANGGINQNGTITVVASGTFAEQVTLTGNVTLQGAPGIEANIDAFKPGAANAAASATRQAQPGIIVNAPNNRYVIIRNVQSRNWTSGIQVRGNSRLAIENTRVEHNVNYGIEVDDNARVSIRNAEVLATGFRLNPQSGDFPTANNPNPGRGVEFDGNSSGTVCSTTVAGSFRDGIRSAEKKSVSLALLNVFDNNPNLSNTGKVGTSCIGGRDNAGDDD